MKYIIITIALLGSIAANAANNDNSANNDWESTIKTQLTRIAEEAETKLINKIENNTTLIIADNAAMSPEVGYATYKFEDYSTVTTWHTGEKPTLKQGASLIAMNI